MLLWELLLLAGLVVLLLLAGLAQALLLAGLALLLLLPKLAMLLLLLVLLSIQTAIVLIYRLSGGRLFSAMSLLLLLLPCRGGLFFQEARQRAHDAAESQLNPALIFALTVLVDGSTDGGL